MLSYTDDIIKRNIWNVNTEWGNKLPLLWKSINLLATARMKITTQFGQLISPVANLWNTRAVDFVPHLFLWRYHFTAYMDRRKDYSIPYMWVLYWDKDKKNQCILFYYYYCSFCSIIRSRAMISPWVSVESVLWSTCCFRGFLTLPRLNYRGTLNPSGFFIMYYVLCTWHEKC